MTTINDLIYKVIFNTKKDAMKEQEELEALGYEIKKVSGSRLYMVINPKTHRKVYVNDCESYVTIHGINERYYRFSYYTYLGDKKTIEDIDKIDFQHLLDTPIKTHNYPVENKFEELKVILKNIKWNIKYHKDNVAKYEEEIAKLQEKIQREKSLVEQYENNLADFKKENLK